MYLSCLLIDVGDNPDRPRPGRLWLRNLYHVHQRLCMAFPSASQKGDDEYFLEPFKPEEFARHQVHVKRETHSGFLFRIDFPVQPYQRWENPRPGGRAVILVQSAVEPEWDYAFQNARHLLAAPPQVKSFDPHFTKGKSYRFRLVANPTRRFSERALTESQATPLIDDEVNQFFEEARQRAQEQGLPQCSEREDIITILQYACGHEKRYDLAANRKRKRLFFEAQRACPDCRNQKQKQQEPVIGGWIGSRVPVRNDQLFDWLAHWAENNEAGFLVDKECTQVQPGYIYVHKKKTPNDKGQRLRTVRYDGILQVTDLDALWKTVIQGIGPGKAYGLGLLSLAPP